MEISKKLDLENNIQAKEKLKDKNDLSENEDRKSIQSLMKWIDIYKKTFKNDLDNKIYEFNTWYSIVVNYSPKLDDYLAYEFKAPWGKNIFKVEFTEDWKYIYRKWEKITRLDTSRTDAKEWSSKRWAGAEPFEYNNPEQNLKLFKKKMKLD